MKKSGCWFFSIFLLGAPPVLATGSPKARDAVISHHKKAERLFRAGRYTKAAEAFLKAHASQKRALFLYLAADAYARGKNRTAALKYYQQYLQSGTSAHYKKLAQKRIQTLTAAQRSTTARPAANAARKAPASDGTQPRTPRTPQKPRTPRPPRTRPLPRPPATKKAARESRPAGKRGSTDATSAPLKKASSSKRSRTKMELSAWALVGTGAVLLTLAGVFALKVEDAEDNMRRLAITTDPANNLRLPYAGSYKKDFEDYRKQGKLYEKLTWTFASISAASVVTAAVLFTLDYLGRRKKRSKTGVAEKNKTTRLLRIQPFVNPQSGGGLTVKTSF